MKTFTLKLSTDDKPVEVKFEDDETSEGITIQSPKNLYIQSLHHRLRGDRAAEINIWEYGVIITYKLSDIEYSLIVEIIKPNSF